MPSYPRLVLILLAVMAIGVMWHAARRPRPTTSDSPPVRPGGIKYDPIEDDERAKSLLAAVDQEVEQITDKDPPERRAQLGYCHVAWALKKRLLKEKHGIEWRTPAEMNPNIAFD